MTPKCKTVNSTTLIIERQAMGVPSENDNKSDVHIAGGDHKGIVINKQASTGMLFIVFGFFLCYLITFIIDFMFVLW